MNRAMEGKEYVTADDGRQYDVISRAYGFAKVMHGDHLTNLVDERNGNRLILEHPVVSIRFTMPSIEEGAYPAKEPTGIIISNDELSCEDAEYCDYIGTDGPQRGKRVFGHMVLQEGRVKAPGGTVFFFRQKNREMGAVIRTEPHCATDGTPVSFSPIVPAQYEKVEPVYPTMELKGKADPSVLGAILAKKTNLWDLFFPGGRVLKDIIPVGDLTKKRPRFVCGLMPICFCSEMNEGQTYVDMRGDILFPPDPMANLGEFDSEKRIATIFVSRMNNDRPLWNITNEKGDTLLPMGTGVPYDRVDELEGGFWITTPGEDISVSLLSKCRPAKFLLLGEKGKGVSAMTDANLDAILSTPFPFPQKDDDSLSPAGSWMLKDDDKVTYCDSEGNQIAPWLDYGQPFSPKRKTVLVGIRTRKDGIVISQEDGFCFVPEKLAPIRFNFLSEKKGLLLEGWPAKATLMESGQATYETDGRRYVIKEDGQVRLAPKEKGMKR